MAGCLILWLLGWLGGKSCDDMNVSAFFGWMNICLVIVRVVCCGGMLLSLD